MTLALFCCVQTYSVHLAERFCEQCGKPICETHTTFGLCPDCFVEATKDLDQQEATPNRGNKAPWLN